MPSQRKSREQSVKATLDNFIHVERFAGSNGLAEYLARGREYYKNATRIELRRGCAPTEASALRDARRAIRVFQAHVATMAHGDSQSRVQ